MPAVRLILLKAVLVINMFTIIIIIIVIIIIIIIIISATDTLATQMTILIHSVTTANPDLTF